MSRVYEKYTHLNKHGYGAPVQPTDQVFLPLYPSPNALSLTPSRPLFPAITFQFYNPAPVNSRNIRGTVTSGNMINVAPIASGLYNFDSTSSLKHF